MFIERWSTGGWEMAQYLAYYADAPFHDFVVRKEAISRGPSISSPHQATNSAHQSSGPHASFLAGFAGFAGFAGWHMPNFIDLV